MPTRSLAAFVVTAWCLAITACGGTDEPDADDLTPTTTSRTVTTSTNETASTTDAPETTVETTPETVAVTAPAETVAVPAEQCPNGSWRIDPAGLGPFELLGSSDDVTVTSGGSFVATFEDGRYTIAAEDFSLDLLTATSDIGMAVAGSTTGELAIGADMLTFVETSFDMTADVTIDGEDVASDFIVEAFHQTFGSATMPYTCNADGTVTITYDTPTGPATAVHERA